MLINQDQVLVTLRLICIDKNWVWDSVSICFCRFKQNVSGLSLFGYDEKKREIVKDGHLGIQEEDKLNHF